MPFDGHVAQASGAVVVLQGLHARRVRVEGVQVCEHRVPLDLPGVRRAQVGGVGEHAHHLATQLVGRVAQVRGVAEALAHLRLPVQARQARRGGQEGLRFHQHVRPVGGWPVQPVEAPDHLARQFQHGQLILPDRDDLRAERRDVRHLRRRVDEEPRRDRLPEAFLRDLGLHGRVLPQLRHRHEVQQVHGQLGQFRHARLLHERHPRRVQARAQVVQHHLRDVPAQHVRPVEMVGQALHVRDEHEDLMRILQRHPRPQ